MSQPSTVSTIFHCSELPGQSLSIPSEGADALEEGAAQMPAPGAEQVGNRQCKQLQPRGSTGIPGQAWDGRDHTGLTDGAGKAGLARPA